MKTDSIYHIVTQAQWALQQSNNYYTQASLLAEGFIHCSTAEQLQPTIQRYYAAEQQVVVLTINPALLTVPLKYELAPSVGELFPHVYGVINMVAIIKVQICKVASNS